MKKNRKTQVSSGHKHIHTLTDFNTDRALKKEPSSDFQGISSHTHTSTHHVDGTMPYGFMPNLCLLMVGVC